ncbi:MAG: type II toxin-antitoxin system RelE/ParE family toxin [Bacilli bacterium]|jgi:mRNA interferase RelE/StbE|nr:type II toxin-antitoxin system RelE/ParE family toxin [Bacilli bacterium]
MYRIEYSNKAVKYLKKLKDVKLKKLFENTIYQKIANSPYKAKKKKNNLYEIWTVGFNYQKTEYRIGYKIKDNAIVIILLCGSYENFYNELVRIIDNYK